MYIALAFLVFLFLNIITRFYPLKFLLNLILALPLFITDLIGMDREVFRGYGFWCYCGLGR